MPRAPRIEFENAIYHVMARGNRREPIVFNDPDRELFVATLSEAVTRCGWEVFAWVLMDNHYHLVFRTPMPNLVEGMQWLQNAYTRRLNARHRLWGHLFGGRYRSILVEDSGQGSRVWQDYLRTVIDYVHLNPASAGLVDGGDTSVIDYPWSSLAKGHVQSPTKRPAWLMTGEVLDLFGERDTAAGRRGLIKRYDQWATAEGLEHEAHEVGGVSLVSRIQRGWFWGSEAFKETLLARVENEDKRESRNYRSSETMRDHHEKQAMRIMEEASEFFGKSIPELGRVTRGDWTRAAVGWAIWKETVVTQVWIAEKLNLKSAANASQQIRRFALEPEKSLPKRIREWKKSRNVA